MSSLIAFWKPLASLIKFSLQYEYGSHVVLIPLVSVGLIYVERKKVFRYPQYSFGIGSILLIGAMILEGFLRQRSLQLSQTGYLSLTVLPIILLWIGGFAFCYGIHALRAAVFPLLFLFLMVPIPDYLLKKVVFLLQQGSAECAYILFRKNDALIAMSAGRSGITVIKRECPGFHPT